MKRIIPYLFGCIFLFIHSYGRDGIETGVPMNMDTAKLLTNIDVAAKFEYWTPDSCITLMTPLLEQSRESGFNDGAGNALVHIGIAYMTKGNVDRALSSYKEAMQYAERCQYDKRFMVLLYTATGFPYLRKNDYAIASTYYYKALQLVMNNGLQSTPAACRLYLGLSNLWWCMRRLDYATRYIYQSEQVAVSKKDTLALIAVYGNLSNLCYNQHQLQKSYSYARWALALAEKKHAVTAEQLLLANIGTSLRQQGTPAAAIPYFRKAISLADDAHSYEYNLQSYYNLSFAYYQLGNYEMAEKYVRYAIRKSEELDMDKERMEEAMQVMAGICEHKKNYKEANVWLNKYMDYVADILQKETDSSMNKLEENYQISERDRRLTQDQLALSKKELEIKDKNVWIWGITGSFLLLGMLFFLVLRTSRHKHRIQSMQIHSLEQEKQLVYLKAMIDGEEKERTRLARELHDGIGGMLAAASMKLNIAKETDHKPADIQVSTEVARLLNDIAIEVRRTAHNLMPDILIKSSLTEALVQYCADISAAGQLEINIQFHGQMEEMSKSVELILYRISQELIQNIIKHAQATQAAIQIIQDNGRLNLIVEDNGVGFDQAEIDGGFGMQNLQFRVEALQGYISISSAKGKGTSTYIEFNLEKLKNV